MPSRDELLEQARQIKREKLLAEAKAMQDKQTEAIAAGEKDRPGLAESVIRGGVKGLSFGLADEATGLLGGVAHGVADTAKNIYNAATTDRTYEDEAKDDKGFWQNYRDVRDYVRKKDELAQAANPKAFKASEIGGGVASAFIPGLGFLNAAKGASIANIAAKGALGGGLTGLGMSDADVTKGELPKALSDTAEGAILGGVTGGVIGAAGKALDPKVLKHLAERRAFKAAIGNQGKVYDQAVAKGEVNKIGRDLLDSGVVQFGSKANSIAKRADKLVDSAGDTIGSIIKQADEAGAKIDGNAIADKIRAYADKIEAPNNKALVSNLREQAEEFAGKGLISPVEAQRLKDSYVWKFGESQALSQKATNKLKGIIGGELDTAVAGVGKARGVVDQVGEMAMTGTTGMASAPRDAVADAVGIAGKDLSAEEQKALASALKDKTLSEVDAKQSLGDLYQAAKSQYGSAATAAKGAAKLASRQEKNRTISLTDTILGGIAGGATLNPYIGLGVAGANKVMRERGSSAMAVTLDKAANLISSTPNLFGSLGPALQSAIRNGSLPAVHYVLMKNNPSYRDLILQEAQKEDQKP